MKRILVVDDELTLLFGICHNLRDQHSKWEAVLALDAEEAYQRLDTAPDIDVLVCDLSMPGGGGEVSIAPCKHEISHVARIVLSGRAHTDSARRARELCHRFLEQPCPAEALQEAIQWPSSATEHRRRNSDRLGYLGGSPTTTWLRCEL